MSQASGAFDGTAEGSSGNATYTSSGNVLTSSSITINSKLEIYTNRTHSGATDGTKITINGTDYFDFALSSTGYTEFDLSGATLPLTSSGNILIEDEGGSASGIWSVRVDGKRLVNSTSTPAAVPSIASTVRANQTAGFSIVSYAGTGNNGTVGHGLNAAPEFMVIKNRDSVLDWDVYHVATGKSKYLVLNGTNASGSSSWMQDTAPTSSVFSVASGTYAFNRSGEDVIAYCFAPVAGYSAFGSFTGNQSTDGPFVYTGFKVAFLLFKVDSSSSNSWFIHDTTRDPSNVATQFLRPNLNNAEGTLSGDGIDLLSNGFKVRKSSTAYNEANQTIIYAAFAENPFQANGGLAR
jgi:hypothetical protein